MALFDPKFYEHEQQDTQPIVRYMQPRKTHGRSIALAACAVLFVILLVSL
jgi:hypothetical protein